MYEHFTGHANNSALWFLLRITASFVIQHHIDLHTHSSWLLKEKRRRLRIRLDLAIELGFFFVSYGGWRANKMLRACLHQQCYLAEPMVLNSSAWFRGFCAVWRCWTSHHSTAPGQPTCHFYTWSALTSRAIWLRASSSADTFSRFGILFLPVTWVPIFF